MGLLWVIYPVKVGEITLLGAKSVLREDKAAPAGRRGGGTQEGDLSCSLLIR